MNSTNFSGMGTALATPFNEDFTIDYNSLALLVDHQIENDADFIVVLGTTGEAVTMTAEEKAQVARFVADRANGRLPLVLGMSGNCTATLCRQIADTDLTGYDAILSVVPFYNRPSQEGIYRHFAAVAEASPVPVILYNVPSRTGANIETTTTLRLAHDYPEKIVAIKEASGRIGQIREIIERKPAGFNVLSGDDALTLPLIAMGAKGVISVIGNAFPKSFSRMVHHALEGRFDLASVDDRPLQPFYRALFAEGNPSGLKSLLCHQHLAKNTLRLPLVPVSDALHEKMGNLLTAFTTKAPTE